MDTLIFKQSAWWKSEWGLFQKERLVGSLKITSAWSWNRAEVRIGEKRYEFGCRGLVSRFFVRDASGTQIMETKSRNFWGSVLDVEYAGRRYALVNKWGNQAAVDDRKAEVVKIKPRYWKYAGEAVLQDASDEGQLLLAFLLFYRMKLMHMVAVAAST